MHIHITVIGRVECNRFARKSQNLRHEPDPAPRDGSDGHARGGGRLIRPDVILYDCERYKSERNPFRGLGDLSETISSKGVTLDILSPAVLCPADQAFRVGVVTKSRLQKHASGNRKPNGSAV